MKERLGEQPEEFYFDEASRMFIRRGDKPPGADTPAETVKKDAKARRPKPELISLMTTEELAELPEWLIPPSKKEEVERFKTRARRRVEIEFDEQFSPPEPPPERPRLLSPKPTEPQVKYGPRGGRYTEDKPRDGRPYRRYF